MHLAWADTRLLRAARRAPFERRAGVALPSAIEPFLDEATADKVRGLWRVLAGAGVLSPMADGDYIPQGTAAVCADLALDAARAEVLAFAGCTGPPAATIASLGLFLAQEAVVFLGASVTTQLSQMRADLQGCFGGFARAP